MKTAVQLELVRDYLFDLREMVQTFAIHCAADDENWSDEKFDEITDLINYLIDLQRKT